MSKPTIRIHNTQTDEIIDREMTDDEFADFEASNAKIEADRLDSETKLQAAQIAKQSAIEKLSALGLTADEVAALIS